MTTTKPPPKKRRVTITELRDQLARQQTTPGSVLEAEHLRQRLSEALAKVSVLYGQRGALGAKVLTLEREAKAMTTPPAPDGTVTADLQTEIVTLRQRLVENERERARTWSRHREEVENARKADGRLYEQLKELRGRHERLVYRVKHKLGWGDPPQPFNPWAAPAPLSAKDYDLIRSCLHPDPQPPERRGRFDKAFAAFTTRVSRPAKKA